MTPIESSPLQAAAENPVAGPLRESEMLSRVGSGLREFFHGTETPYRLALVRICLAFTLLFPTAYRWFYSREIFSTDGSGLSLLEHLRQSVAVVGTERNRGGRHRQHRDSGTCHVVPWLVHAVVAGLGDRWLHVREHARHPVQLE